MVVCPWMIPQHANKATSSQKNACQSSLWRHTKPVKVPWLYLVQSCLHILYPWQDYRTISVSKPNILTPVLALHRAMHRPLVHCEDQGNWNTEAWTEDAGQTPQLIFNPLTRSGRDKMSTLWQQTATRGSVAKRGAQKQTKPKQVESENGKKG